MGRGGVIPSKRPLSLGKNTHFPWFQAGMRLGWRENFGVRILLESVKRLDRFGKVLRFQGESGIFWEGVILNPRKGDSEPTFE